MGTSRRTFLLSSGVLSSGALAALACRSPAAVAPVRKPSFYNEGAEPHVDHALARAKQLGARYADVRMVRRESQRVSTREDHVVGIEHDETFGIGVRVLVGHSWGFAATSMVDENGVKGAVEKAVANAKANQAIQKRPVELAPTPAVRDSWHSRVVRDPFAIPLGEQVEFLLALWREVERVPLVKHANASIEALGESKLFASSEGTRIEQSITRIAPWFEVTAVDTEHGEFESRAFEIPPMQAGYEYVTSSRLKSDARAIAEDAVRKLKSPTVSPGVRDLILAPSNMWLTIHESVGHATELDRAFGYEANLAGTSFATPDQIGKLRFASPLLSFYADRTTPGGLATCGYDDDGVATLRFDLIRDGVLVDFQTTRDQAGWIGRKTSHATSYAEDHKGFPFQRMPNVSMAPGSAKKDLQGLIADTEDAILVTGDASYSIDHQRFNFQFGGQMFYEVKKGKIARTLRNVAYQANTLQFWNSCDAIGGADSWELFGALNDGKGEPMQFNAVSHGCPPARFRRINILATDVRKGS